MDSSTRWIGIAAVLGLCTAYALWGARPATGPELPAPGATTPPQIPNMGMQSPPLGKQPAPVSILKINPDNVDFGEVKVPESRKVTVQVENPGPKTITVDDVKGSCGCLKVDMPQRKIEPGKSAPLNLNFSALSGKRPEAYTVTLITDEEGKAKAMLPIRCKVIQIFNVEPQAVYFEDAVKGIPKTQEATITRVDGKPFTIRTIVANHKEFSFKWEPLPNSNGSAYKILATVTGIEPTAFTEGAAIMTDHPDVPAMALNMGVRVTGEVVSKTPVITAIQRDDNTIESFETVIKRVTPGPLEIKGVEESEKRAVQFTQTAVDESSAKVTITFSGAYPDKLPFGSFLVRTNVEATPLQVPYRVVRRGAQRLDRGGGPGPAPAIPKP